MIEILRLYFDKNKEGQYLTLCSEFKTLQELHLTDWIDISYNGGVYYRVSYDETGGMLRYQLLEMLEKLLKVELRLDTSITKSLGYCWAQFSKNPHRKNLKCREDKEGDRYWVGGKHNLFDSSYQYQQETWVYNDEQGNIFFELSPAYPWFFSEPQEGETFLKYSEWLKDYKPYVVRQISREVVEGWVQQLEEVLKIIEANDKRVSCRGPGCKLCKEDGSELYKTFCKCEKCEEYHKYNTLS